MKEYTLYSLISLILYFLVASLIGKWLKGCSHEP